MNTLCLTLFPLVSVSVDIVFLEYIYLLDRKKKKKRGKMKDKNVRGTAIGKITSYDDLEEKEKFNSSNRYYSVLINCK